MAGKKGLKLARGRKVLRNRQFDFARHTVRRAQKSRSMVSNAARKIQINFRGREGSAKFFGDRYQIFREAINSQQAPLPAR
jgi:hypothetical protein